MFIPKDQIDWKKVRYLKEPLGGTDDEAIWKYELWLNEPLASWDVFSYWERQRVASMERHLKKGDILFDIGTEQGWCDLVYAHIVGPENMVLVEPTPEFWPNIKALWQRNFGSENGFNMPKACYSGFFSNKSENGHIITHNDWPIEAYGDLIDRNSYRNLSDPSHTTQIQQITLDDFVESSGIIPNAITIDVEGAELLVLRGAEKTLTENNVKVWVSEHDDLGLKEYRITSEDVKDFMEYLGYKREDLGTDHERHVYYSR